jgi:hypothetical protein
MPHGRHQSSSNPRDYDLCLCPYLCLRPSQRPPRDPQGRRPRKRQSRCTSINFTGSLSEPVGCWLDAAKPAQDCLRASTTLATLFIFCCTIASGAIIEHGPWKATATGSDGRWDSRPVYKSEVTVQYYVVIGGLFGGFKGGEVSRGSAAVSRRSAIAQCGRTASNYRCWVGLCECCSPGEARS